MSKLLCKHCGKVHEDSKHIKYGPDLDNQAKHEFEPMPTDITLEQMVELMEKVRAIFPEIYYPIIDAILSALEPKPDPLFTISWMKLAEELNVPFSVVKIIRDRVEAERTDGPSKEERKEALEYYNSVVSNTPILISISQEKMDNIIRALILGNQGGTVSPDTRVSPRGETSGAVTDIPKWAERIHADANLGVMHVQHLLEEMLREVGAAGKEEK